MVGKAGNCNLSTSEQLFSRAEAEFSRLATTGWVGGLISTIGGWNVFKEFFVVLPPRFLGKLSPLLCTDPLPLVCNFPDWVLEPVLTWGFLVRSAEPSILNKVENRQISTHNHCWQLQWLNLVGPSELGWGAPLQFNVGTVTLRTDGWTNYSCGNNREATHFEPNKNNSFRPTNQLTGQVQAGWAPSVYSYQMVKLKYIKLYIMFLSQNSDLKLARLPL